MIREGIGLIVGVGKRIKFELYRENHLLLIDEEKKIRLRVVDQFGLDLLDHQLTVEDIKSRCADELPLEYRREFLGLILEYISTSEQILKTKELASKIVGRDLWWERIDLLKRAIS